MHLDDGFLPITILHSSWRMRRLVDLEICFVNVAKEEREPGIIGSVYVPKEIFGLYSPPDDLEVVTRGNTLVHSMDVAQSIVFFIHVSRTKPEDVLRQIPVIPCVGVASHEGRRNNCILSIQSPNGA